MPTLPWILLAAGLAQATAPPAPAPAAQQAPSNVSTPTPLDEVIVTARPPHPKPAPTYSVVTGVRAREFEAESTRKERLRRYRESGSLKDYPGLRCAIFHRC